MTIKHQKYIRRIHQSTENNYSMYIRTYNIMYDNDDDDGDDDSDKNNNNNNNINSNNNNK